MPGPFAGSTTEEFAVEGMGGIAQIHDTDLLVWIGTLQAGSGLVRLLTPALFSFTATSILQMSMFSLLYSSLIHNIRFASFFFYLIQLDF